MRGRVCGRGEEGGCAGVGGGPGGLWGGVSGGGCGEGCCGEFFGGEILHYFWRVCDDCC